MSFKVSNDKVSHGVASLHRGTPNMRQENDILKPKKLFRHFRLMFKHIKPSPTQSAFHQRRYELGFINMWASTNVDENTLRA